MNYQEKGLFISSGLHLAFILMIVGFTNAFKEEPQRVILDFEIVKEKVPPKGGGNTKKGLYQRLERQRHKEDLEKQEPQETLPLPSESIEKIDANFGFNGISKGEGGIGGGIGEGIGGGTEGIGGGIGEGIEAGSEGGIFEAYNLDQPLKIISYISPKYPEDAKEHGIAGIVKIRLLINPKGLVEDIKIIEENPKGFGFKDEVLKVVKDYRFTQPKILGRPVSVYYILPLRFSLED